MVMRKAMLLAFVLVTAYTHAQFSINGKVVDNEGNPLPGANLSLVPGNKGTISSKDGTYAFPDLANGNYQLSVSYVGFQGEKKEVPLNSEDYSLVFKLSPKTIYTEDVIVKGVRATSKTPVTYSSLDRKEVQSIYHGEHPVFFIKQLTPSVTTESESGTSFANYGTMRLRGMEQKRINFTLNGIPLNDMMDHGLYFSNFTDISNSFQSVQIQRGVGTSSNGAASYAGSVNFESINLEKQPTGTELQLGYGSYNSKRLNAQFNSGLLKNNFAFHGSFSRIHSDGYKDNTESDAYSFFFSAGYFGKRDVLKLNVFDARSKNGLGYVAVDKETLQNNPTINYLDENDRDDFGQQFVQLQHIHTFNNTLNLVSSFYYNGAGGDFPWGFRDTANVLIQYNYPLTNDHYGIISNLNYTGTALNLSGGIHGYIFLRNNLEQVVPDYKKPYYDEHSQKTELSAFAKATYHLGAFTLFADAEIRSLEMRIHPDFSYLGIADSTDLTTSYVFFNPKAGISYSPSKEVVIYASVGQTHREPTKVDIIGGWGLYDTDTYYALLNNIDFQSEEVTDMEIGTRINSARWNAEANVFYMWFKNEILPTGETIAFGSQLRTNIPDSKRYGLEVLAAYRVWENLSVSGNIMAMQTNLTNIRFAGDTLDRNNLQAPFTPNLIANAQIEYTPAKFISLAVSGRYVSNSFMTLQNEPNYIIPEYFVLNSSITFQIIDRANLRIDLNNLTNKQYYTKGEPVDTDGDWIPDAPGYFINAPLNIFCTLAVRF